MELKEIMSRNIISVSPGESVSAAARLLARHNIGALPVCTKEGKLRGMVTDRDIVLRCVAPEDDAQSMKVGELMTRRIISAQSTATVEEAADLMAREQIRRLPVEENGKLVGMLSLGDLAKQPGAGADRALTEISSNLRLL